MKLALTLYSAHKKKAKQQSGAFGDVACGPVRSLLLCYTLNELKDSNVCTVVVVIIAGRKKLNYTFFPPVMGTSEHIHHTAKSPW